VTPAVNEFVSLRNEEEFHDTSTVLFEIPNDNTRVEGYSSRQHIYDVYYGQTAIHSPERSTFGYQSDLALLMNSSDSRCGFHDYYYGQEHCGIIEDHLAPHNQQPLHDVYFGQDALSERLSFTTSLSSPGSTRSLNGSYSGQQEIQPIDHSRCRVRVAAQQMRTKCRSKLYFVVFLLLGILRGAIHPKVMTRHSKVILKNKSNSSSNSIFTNDSVILKDSKVGGGRARITGWF
jgi:hypothetical protein